MLGLIYAECNVHHAYIPMPRFQNDLFPNAQASLKELISLSYLQPNKKRWKDEKRPRGMNTQILLSSIHPPIAHELVSPSFHPRTRNIRSQHHPLLKPLLHQSLAHLLPSPHPTGTVPPPSRPARESVHLLCPVLQVCPSLPLWLYLPVSRSLLISFVML